MGITAFHNVGFAVTDLDKTEQFAKDFGLQTVSNDGQDLFMRTDGGDAWCYHATKAETPAFQYFGFIVESEADLEQAVRDHGASPIRELNSPGGGRAVTLTSPEGMKFDLIHGVKPGPDAAKVPDAYLKLNAPGEATRHATAQKHSELGPVTLYRLGHAGIFTKDYAKISAWLQDVLGLTCSDEIYAGDPNHKVVGFFRIDRGEEWVDHHSIFLGQMGDKPDIHHISFEVQDYETQFRAHRWLTEKGWELAYGVGRHPLGSHIFDMWRDPDRFRFESFSDTDLVNCNHKSGIHNLEGQDIDMWSSADQMSYFT